MYGCGGTECAVRKASVVTVNWNSDNGNWNVNGYDVPNDWNDGNHVILRNKQNGQKRVIYCTFFAFGNLSVSAFFHPPIILPISKSC